MSDEITAELLLSAYAQGFFPMAKNRDDPTLHWFDPSERGILPLDGLHVGRSLGKALRRRNYEIRCNTAFDRVISLCAEPTADRGETWINAPIVALYKELHERGHAHSVETWREDNLIGGLYGVSLGGAFFGESMFSRAANASKLALVHLVARLRLAGFSLLDTQFITPHLESLGAVAISRASYRKRLAEALTTHHDFLSSPPEARLQRELSLICSESRPVTSVRPG